MARRRSAFKIPGYRKPSLNRALGITQAKRKIGWGRLTNPKAALKRDIKRATGYYSKPARTMRKAQKGCGLLVMALAGVGLLLAGLVK